MGFEEPKLNLSPKVSDEIRKTTCYMCACRCGINVHMKEGKVAYIEGNRDHPVNKGVLCAKGSAGIMQVNAPSRLRAPLKRYSWRRIGWSRSIKKTPKNWRFLPGAINHKVSPPFGPRGSARLTMQPTVAFAR